MSVRNSRTLTQTYSLLAAVSVAIATWLAITQRGDLLALLHNGAVFHLPVVDRASARGGLGAMETGYQRSKIEEESMRYEIQKHTGEYSIVGVNTFRNPQGDAVPEQIELARSTDEEKQSQLARLAEFQARHAADSPAMLKRLQQAVIDNANVFEVLMDAVRCCSLGQITSALFEVGGQYRRSM